MILALSLARLLYKNCHFMLYSTKLNLILLARKFTIKTSLFKRLKISYDIKVVIRRCLLPPPPSFAHITLIWRVFFPVPLEASHNIWTARTITLK